MSTVFVHGLNPLKLAQFFVRRLHRQHFTNHHESKPKKGQIVGLKLMRRRFFHVAEEVHAALIYQQGPDRYESRCEMADLRRWLAGMLVADQIVPSAKMNDVHIEEIEIDEDTYYLKRIRWSLAGVNARRSHENFEDPWGDKTPYQISIVCD